ELSEAGIALYKQLASQNRFGQQTFVVRPGESVEISGVLMKVENINNLNKCPIGAAGVVAEYGASCTKKFSRTIEYAEAVQRGTFSMSLRDMQAETFSPNGSTVGCDIDVTTTISNQ
ncbi:MAG: hypothetical protein R3240_09540, partial [Gammaproteobacteria bacterium]|nr:hypothetical protein [Gammaproteobacteria bacterium]